MVRVMASMDKRPRRRNRPAKSFTLFPYIGERHLQLLMIALSITGGALWLPDAWPFALLAFCIAAVLIGFEFAYVLRHEPTASTIIDVEDVSWGTDDKKSIFHWEDSLWDAGQLARICGTHDDKVLFLGAVRTDLNWTWALWDGKTAEAFGGRLPKNFDWSAALGSAHLLWAEKPKERDALIAQYFGHVSDREDFSL
jgi:hypothetical protein